MFIADQKGKFVWEVIETVSLDELSLYLAWEKIKKAERKEGGDKTRVERNRRASRGRSRIQRR